MKIRRLRDKVTSGMQRGGFILSLSFRSLRFEGAERAYAEELKRLQGKIRKQAKVARREIDEANHAINRLHQSGLLENVQPGHPNHVNSNGTLTPTGTMCCATLFDAGASPLVVAHLMRLSLRATTARHTARKHKQLATAPTEA